MYISRKSRSFLSPSVSGSALPAILVICALMLIVATTMLTTVSRQKKLNQSMNLLVEARSAAEGAAESALSEMTRRAYSYSSLSTDPLSGFTLPADDVTFLAGTNSSGRVLSTSIGFKNSLLSDRPSGPMLIDETDPVNKSDPDKGKTLIVRYCNIYGTASSKDPVTGNTHSSYVSEVIQVREQSWFNYAVFYNMDMEFHAGPNFDITGPVHTNANAYVLEGAGATFTAHSTFTSAQQIFRFLKYYLPTHTHIKTDGTNFNGVVEFAANPHPITAMDFTEDSTRSDWLTFAESKWNYFVQDTAFSVKPFAPDGMPTYTPEDFTTAAVELRNSAYLLIEPQLSNDTSNASIAEPADYSKPAYANGRYGQKALSAENLKFSALSGFVIKVRPPDGESGLQPHWWLCYYDVPDNTRPVNKDNLPSRNADGTPVEHIIDPFAHTDYDAVPLAQQMLTANLKTQLLQAIVSVPYKDGGGGTYGNGNSTLTGLNIPMPLSAAHTTAWNLPGGPYYGLYDQRQGFIYPSGGPTGAYNDGLKGAYNVLYVDMAKLNALLTDTTAGLWTKPADNSTLYSVSKNYSGIVYVEFPLDTMTASRFPATTADGDMIRPSIQRSSTIPGYALIVKNAAVVPRILPEDLSRRDDGFTIATNGPVYILGNYNADGNSSTGSSTAPDSVTTTPTATSELPAIVAGDSVTILTAGFNFGNSATSVDPSASSASTTSNFTEVSAAIITGLVPTHPGYNNVWSGGVHNFIRYLENWSGNTFRYRGSLAALFESEVSKGEYHDGFNPFYGPPTRDMGYHQYLAQGWLPPGTPIKRTIRRMAVTDISASNYTAGPTQPPPSL